MIQNEYAPAVAPRRSILDRDFRLDRLGVEVLLYGLLLILSIGLHLWGLDVKAMHHDESIHAWMSYKFFTGAGPFTCAGGRQSATYCYDPVYHGPSLYVLTLLAYFLFGVGEAQARLPEALAGIALVPMAWTLRPFIGRKGALIAAALMTVSPSILYYTRFARHDALVLLWSMFMVVGLFKFLREGGAFNLSLAAAGLALTWATHELVFILIFIGGSFFAFRLLWEWRPRLFAIASSVAMIVAGAIIVAAASVTQQQSPYLHSLIQRLLGPGMLLGVGALLTLPMSASWERAPIVRERLVDTWRFERKAFWAALATFLTLFTLLFTTFFAYPRGFLDGWYQGIAYWLGSQHEYARGEQPWFYYLMLLPIYDLLALVFGLVGLSWLLFSGWRSNRSRQVAQESTTVAPDGQLTHWFPEDGAGDGADAEARPIQTPTPNVRPSAAPPLMVFFLGYWFVQAFVGFSWAGEKMPWLLTHISLPATLLAAWTLGVLISRVPWRSLRHGYGSAVPLLTIVLIVAIFVAAYAFSGSDQTVAGVRARLQGLIPLIAAGGCVFGLLTIANHIGGRGVLRLAGLALAAVLLLYGVRAAILVNFVHPDTPVEPLIYTQTAPDVTRLVRQIKDLSINQSRNQRSVEDPTGGLSLPIVLDGGASKHGGEGSLAWPMQWYLRDYKNVSWLDVDTNSTIKPDAGMVVLYKPHVTDALRSQLEDDYVQTSDGVFNWWFPEFTGEYDANKPGQAPARGYKSLGAEGVGAVLSWPFNPSNWPTLMRYMLYRDLPQELKGREMEVWVRRDLAPGAASPAAAIPVETLAPEATVAQGAFDNGRGMTVDASGNLYITDATNHQVHVLNPDGTPLRTMGNFGNGDGQLNEPSGVAVDDDGNVYVADTWNGRIAKFSADGKFIKAWGTRGTQFGEPINDPLTGQTVQRFATDNKGDPTANTQNPLGFFGPRNVLVKGDRVYIADTGNSRIVVTDREGTFVQQFGNLGTAAGQMHEPIGLGMDREGRLYVGDTWNGRIQIFQRAADGTIDPTSLTTFDVKGWAANTYYDPYIAVAPDGRVWASLGARNLVAQFDANQQPVRRIKTEPPLNAPKGLAWSGDDTLYLVNSGANEVLRFRMP